MLLSRNSVHARLTGLVALLLLSVILALYVSVRLVTESAIRQGASDRLAVGLRVFEQLLDTRAAQLRDGVVVLAADFGFREAVASGDLPTMHSVMLNQATRIGAQIALLMDDQERILASNVPGMPAGAYFPHTAALAIDSTLGRGAGVVVLGHEPYLLVEAEIRAPLPIARVVMGFHMGQDMAADLRSLVNLEVSFAAIGRTGESHVESTLAPDEVRVLLPAWQAGDLPDGMEELELDGRSYLTDELVLASEPDYRMIAFVHSSLDEALASFHELDSRMLLIALTALLVSLLGAQLLARSISKPVRQLARVAERVGQGDYRTPVELHRNDELGSLAGALNHMQAAIAERERRLAHNALHDPLTGLPNRALAIERLENAIRTERPLALLHLGADGFKAVYDACGASCVETAIQTFVHRVKSALPAGASLARPVVDEFLVQVDALGADASVGLADRLLQALGEPLVIEGHEFRIETRCGIALYPIDGVTADDVLRRAAIAMRDAAAQPGRLQLYQQGRDHAYDRQITLVRDLRHAGERGELLLHFQPKLDIRSGQVQQAEALLRWQHPAFGMVSPGEFIPLAERTGSIQHLTAWVIEAVLRQLAQWGERGVSVQVSLNISAEDLMSIDLPDRVRDLLGRYRVPAEQLVFEITESAVMQDQGRALAVLNGLRALGIHLSVDDFGTGYSSLAQLKRMPVQELKIDQSFIRELDEASDDAVIVRSTIDMSHALGLKIVAEGIEHGHSLDLLERWGCDVAQGYLISRPLPAAAFEHWLAERQRLPVSVE